MSMGVDRLKLQPTKKVYFTSLYKPTRSVYFTSLHKPTKSVFPTSLHTTPPDAAAMAYQWELNYIQSYNTRSID
jgi:hypothetical protein